MSLSAESSQALKEVVGQYDAAKGLYVVSQLGISALMLAQEQEDMELGSIMGLTREEWDVYVEQQKAMSEWPNE